METLKEIIGLINSSRFKQSDYLELDKLNTKTKFGQLYFGISTGKIQSDKDAAELIYNDKPGSAPYRKLKSRFGDKLINTLLTLDFDKKGASQLAKMTFECNKYLLIARILKANGCNHAAMKIIQGSWKNAEKYKLYDILAQYSNFLAIEYSTEGNLTLFRKYDTLYEKYLQESVNYDKARKLLQYTEALTVRKTILTKEMVKEYQSAKETVEKLSKISENYHLKSIVHLLSMGFLDKTNNYKDLIKECKQSESFFIKNYGENSANLLIVNAYVFKALLNLKEYKEGVALSISSRTNIATGQFNWFVLKEYQFQLLLHAGEYVAANDILNMVKQNNQYKLQSTTIKEKWNIFEAYLYYIADIKQLPGILPRNYSDFRRRVSASSITTADKSGMNTALLLLKYFIMLRDRKFDDLYDSFDAIKVYVNRYLKGEENVRTYSIFKILMETIKSDFDLRKNQQVPKQLQLLNNGEGKYGIIHQWEILRYDILWEISAR
jgi:hypothetical protein